MNTNIATVLTITAAVFLGACSKKEQPPVVPTPAPVVTPAPAASEPAASAPVTVPGNTQVKEQTK